MRKEAIKPVFFHIGSYCVVLATFKQINGILNSFWEGNIIHWASSLLYGRRDEKKLTGKLILVFCLGFTGELFGRFLFPHEGIVGYLLLLLLLLDFLLLLNIVLF